MPLSSFAARLVRWQRAHGRHGLPWQADRGAYRIWLSEIMLQQTQVSAVVPYFERFMQRFADIQALAAAEQDEVLAAWSGLGYYSRARNLHRAAKQMVEQHGGAIPVGLEALCALPGIGRSTAAAIAVFAYGARAAILDGNVKRVLARHRAIAGYPGERKVEQALWAAAETALPKRDIEAYTQGLMDLGATVCVRRQPQCASCPVKEDCRALLEGRIDQLPAPRPRKRVPQRSTHVLLALSAAQVLLERRPSSGIWGGLWSLPELLQSQGPEAYCQARFGFVPDRVQELAAIEHGFTHFRLRMHPMRCDVSARNARKLAEPGLTWLNLTEVDGAALPAPIKKLLIEIRATPPA